MQQRQPLGEKGLGLGVVQPAFAISAVHQLLRQCGRGSVDGHHVLHGQLQGERRRNIRQRRQRVLPHKGRQQLHRHGQAGALLGQQKGGTLCSIFAKALARAGAKVALLGRNMDKLKELADEIEAEGGTAKGYTCNVMNKANCLQVAEDVLADLGPCDILVNGAGGNNARANTDKEYFEMADLESDTVTFFDLDESGVEMVFNLNFIGTLLPTQAFARQMVGREGCNILNISSMNAYLPLTKIPAYSGSKAAVTNFTQWLAVHFSKVGIRVNAIAPGFFASEQNAKLLFNEDGTPTERTKKILAATPMGHFGDSEKDLVGALLFLLNNEAAGFITGICLPVDGGFSAYSGV